MNQVLERNLQALMGQAYHPVRPRQAFREELLAELQSRLEGRLPSGPCREGRRVGASRRLALASAAALLIAVPLLTLAALELVSEPGSGPVRDLPGTLDAHAVAEDSGFADDERADLQAAQDAAGRRPLEAEESGVPGPGPAGPQALASLDSGVLVGRVVDAVTGSPVTRFVLWRRPERDLPEISRAVSFEVDDEQGLFRLESVAPDHYALFVEAPGFAIWKLRGARVEGGRESRHEVRLGRGSAVHGHVLDFETGAPVPDARVFAEFDLPHGLMEFGGRYLPRSPAASTLTDANGAYTLEHLSPGQHQLRVSHPDHAPTWSTTFELPAGAEGSPFELRHLLLETGGRLEGRVEQPDGTPWAGVEVIASLIAMDRPQPVMAYGVAITDRDGAYAIERMPAGYYVAMHQGDTPGALHTVSKMRQTTVRSGATTELDFVPRVGGCELSGVLSDSNHRPLPGYTVYLNPNPLGEAFQDWIATPVRADGRYRFQNVAAGSYDLYVAENADRMLWIRRLEVAGPLDLQVDLQLPVGAVSGTVSTAAGPVTSAMVILMRWDLEGSDWAFHGKGNSGLDGGYAFVGLGPGRYRLSAMGLSPSRGSANPPPFEVREEEHHQDIILLAGGSLSLQVLDEAGDPVAGAQVRLLDASGLELAYHAEATTDATGRQSIPSLAQGAWTVIVTREGMREQRASAQVLVGEESHLRVTLRRSSGH